MVIKNGVAHVQAGGGIVADSVPAEEYQETVNKARALLTALELAHRSARKVAKASQSEKATSPAVAKKRRK
jgi:anthranilate synthase component 1